MCMNLQHTAQRLTSKGPFHSRDVLSQRHQPQRITQLDVLPEMRNSYTHQSTTGLKLK